MSEPEHGSGEGGAVGQLGARLRVARRQAGLSLRELARQLSVSPSFLSQMENGKSQPSVATLYSIAQVLGVSIDELFHTDDAASPTELAATGTTNATTGAVAAASPRAGAVSRSAMASPAEAFDREPRRLTVSRPAQRRRLEMDSGVIWEQLADSASDVDFIEIIYPAGSSSTNDQKMMRHAGQEYGYLLEGELEVTVGFEVFTIGPGDALSFDSSVPHLLRNRTDVDARGIWCVLHPH
jgi:transcriptional regulator with XRE-family HTH domain/mannose-6-phosphate isomerase-like protein (cupin superfamily)